MTDLTLKRATMLRQKAEDAYARNPDNDDLLRALQDAGGHEMDVYLAGFDRRHPRWPVTELPPTPEYRTQGTAIRPRTTSGPGSKGIPNRKRIRKPRRKS